MHNDQHINVERTLAFSFLAFAILLATVIIFIYMARKKIIEHKLKNKDLQLQMQKEVLNAVITTQEQEHIRVARDLHDEVSSKLNALTMNVHLLKKNNLTENERQEIANYTLEACHLLIESTRRISHNLMPPTLEYMGLHQATAELCKEFSMGEQVFIHYTNVLEGDIFELISHENQVHLFRIIQELINNSIRHGKATEIWITFEEFVNARKMEYIDNGVGMPLEIIKQSKGIGLSNIKARAEIIQGTPYFDPTFKKGFRFELTF